MIHKVNFHSVRYKIVQIGVILLILHRKNYTVDPSSFRLKQLYIYLRWNSVFYKQDKNKVAVQIKGFQL